MYAIVDVAGQQFKVEIGQKIYVHRLSGSEGDLIDIDQVLLIDMGEKILIGNPVVKGARVTAKVIEHARGDKVKVFKKKRRKGYQVLKGHRDDLTHLIIESIDEKAPAGKTAVETKTPVKKESSVKSAPKKAEAKKPAAKSSAAKTVEKKATTPKSTVKTSQKKTGKAEKTTQATKSASSVKNAEHTASSAGETKTSSTTKKSGPDAKSKTSAKSKTPKSGMKKDPAKGSAKKKSTDKK